MPNNINLLYYKDLVALGYGSKATIWRKVKAGKFPKPIDCGGRPAWPESVIIIWLDEKISQAAA
jgi:predicted DNA-binding transcriptional regulator AlpA